MACSGGQSNAETLEGFHEVNLASPTTPDLQVGTSPRVCWEKPAGTTLPDQVCPELRPLLLLIRRQQELIFDPGAALSHILSDFFGVFKLLGVRRLKIGSRICVQG